MDPMTTASTLEVLAAFESRQVLGRLPVDARRNEHGQHRHAGIVNPDGYIQGCRGRLKKRHFVVNGLQHVGVDQ